MTPVESLKVGVAIPGAGRGERMGGVRKPFLEINGEPVLVCLEVDEPLLALSRGGRRRPSRCHERVCEENDLSLAQDAHGDDELTSSSGCKGRVACEGEE